MGSSGATCSTRWRGGCRSAAAVAACSAPEGPLPGLDHEVLATDIGNMRSTTGTPCSTSSRAFRPDLVLHGGAFTAVDACETEVDLAFAVNAIGTRHVAEAAAAVGAHLVYVSTDYVFDGTSGPAVPRVGRPEPALGLRRAQAGRRAGVPAGIDHRAHLVGLRGPRGEHGQDRAAAGRGRPATLRFVDDQHGSPTFTADLAAAIVTLGPRPPPRHSST